MKYLQNIKIILKIETPTNESIKIIIQNKNSKHFQVYEGR